ncbi:P-loop containing nucleoside triphosphate hydrolase protein [Sporodiniella umbellata]|nr:P-loop containing nucleoside triphosphate hydrolase protein [Sporodiniella umbellata]
MGVDQSKMTANTLWKQETAKRGLQILGAAGSAVLLCPVIVLAMPIIGAYELSQHTEEGERMMEGALGGLLGIVVAPLAPFYQFLSSIHHVFLRPALSLDRERAQGMLRLDFNYHNLAVVGSPGTGKSSFINALLGYQAAKVGEIETTLEPKAYRHPSLTSLALWDMPGIGTLRHPSKGYFENYCLGAFDALLIVFDDRFMATDIEFARKAMQYNVPVFFIRNKADMSVERKTKRISHLSSNEAWASAVSQLTLEVISFSLISF